MESEVKLFIPQFFEQKIIKKVGSLVFKKSENSNHIFPVSIKYSA